MNSPSASYDLNALIQRLKAVQNQEIIRQFHSLLDLFDKKKVSQEPSFQISHEEFLAKIDAAEKSIREGTTIPQDKFKSEVKEWLSRKMK